MTTEIAGSWDALVTGSAAGGQQSRPGGGVVEDIYYVKRELFDLPWQGVDLASQLWALAPNGGPIAMIRDSRQFIEITSGPITPTLQIYNGSGALLGSMPWHAMDSVVALCWSPDDHLLVLDRIGRVSVRGWDCKELKEKSFSLPLDIGDEIVFVRSAGPSLVAATSTGTVFIVTNVREPAPEVLATLDPQTSGILDLALVPASLSASGALEVLIITERQLLRLDASGKAVVALPSTPSVLSVAPNGQLVAVLSDAPGAAGLVRVYTLADVTTECVAEVRVPRAQDWEEAVDLAWCGSDAVALLSSSCRLSIASPFGDLLHYDLDGQALLATETDGLRVLTRKRHVFISRVPQCSLDTFQIGSVEPPARLLDARIKFDDQNPDCDRILRSLGASTASAVATLTEAALQEWNVGLQRSLLQAACLGAVQQRKQQQPQQASAPRGKVGEISLLLRALNTARKAPFSMGITAPQLTDLTPRGLVLRMCHQGQHPAAYQLAKELGIACSEVLEHWAANRIASAPPSEGDPAILATLQDRLSMEPSVSYSAVAGHAARTGRRALAAQILELEPSASRAVPLLLDLGVSFPRALDKAVQSGDPDLVYLCIFHALRDDSDRSRLDALRAVGARPLARTLFLSYCNQAGMADLARELESAPERVHGDLEAAAQAVSKRPREKETAAAVEKALRSFRSVGPEGAPFDKYLGDWPRLLTRQAALEKETSLRGLQGLHLTATLKQLIISGHPKPAQDLAKEFGVSERRFLQVQVDALITCRSWDRLLDYVGREPASSSGLIPAPTSPELLLPSLKGTDAPPHLVRHIIRRLPATDPGKRAAAYREWGMEQEALLEESGRGTALASPGQSAPKEGGSKGWLQSWRGGK